MLATCATSVVGATLLASAAPGPSLAIAKSADLLTLLQNRSPGERAGGRLAQSKPDRAAPLFERVLPTMRTRPASGAPATAALAPVDFAAPLFPAAPAFVPASVGPLGAFAPEQEAAGVAPIGGVPLPGGFPVAGGAPVPGGGSDVTPTPTPTPTATPTPPTGTVSAVPEPLSWVMLLLGFSGVGLALRRGAAPGSPGGRRRRACPGR